MDAMNILARSPRGVGVSSGRDGGRFGRAFEDAMTNGGLGRVDGPEVAVAITGFAAGPRWMPIRRPGSCTCRRQDRECPA